MGHKEQEKQEILFSHKEQEKQENEFKTFVTFLQKKEHTITHWMMKDIEVIDVEMSNFRDNSSCFLLFFVVRQYLNIFCFSCSLWLNNTSIPSVSSVLCG